MTSPELSAERFELVPAEFASYRIDLDTAAKLLGADPKRAAELATDSLPHTDDPARGPLFDYVDLMNLALFAGTSRESIPELALRFLVRFAAGPQPSWYEPRQWLVRVRAPKTSADAPRAVADAPRAMADAPQAVADAPRAMRAMADAPRAMADAPQAGGADPARSEYVLLGPDLTASGVEELGEQDLPATGAAATAAKVEPPGYQIAVRLTGAEDTVREPAARRIYADLLGALRSGDVLYQSVTEGLRMQHRAAWKLGMADCVVVSRLLADELRAAGLEARARRGYLLGLVGSDHAWCELREDGRWKTLDVAFAFLAGGAGRRRVEASPEFVEACLGGRFNRLLPCATEEATALILSDGEPAPPWALAGVSAHTWEA